MDRRISGATVGVVTTALYAAVAGGPESVSRMNVRNELAGRVALVTGSARNIGRAIALALADAGAGVMVSARQSIREAEAVVEDIRQAGGRAAAATADVGDPDAAAGLVATAVERLG